MVVGDHRVVERPLHLHERALRGRRPTHLPPGLGDERGQLLPDDSAVIDDEQVGRVALSSPGSARSVVPGEPAGVSLSRIGRAIP